MQNLSAFPPDLRKSRKFDINSLFYSSKSVPALPHYQFIPYSKQRDSLGRLLSKQHQRNPQKQQKLSPEMKRSPWNDKRKSETEENREKIMGQFFRKIDIESRELQRAKSQHRKKVILLDKKNNKKIYPNKYYDIEVGEGSLIKLTKKQTPNIKVKRVQSHQHIRKQQVKVEEKPVKKKQQPKHKESKDSKRGLFSPVNLKLSADQPDLREHLKMKKLQIKVFNDYEKGHEKFKAKMQSTKFLAHKIKRELELQ